MLTYSAPSAEMAMLFERWFLSAGRSATTVSGAPDGVMAPSAMAYRRMASSVPK